MMTLWKHYASEVAKIVEFLNGIDEVPDAVRRKKFLPAIRATESKDLEERHKGEASQNGNGTDPQESEQKSSWIRGDWTLAAPQQVVISPLRYDPGLFPHIIRAHDLVTYSTNEWELESHFIIFQKHYSVLT